MRGFVVLILTCILAGCAGGTIKTDPCIIAPPKEASLQEEQANKIGADLTAFVKLPIKANMENDFKNKANTTFQTIPDKDVACQMLLQTITCLSQKPDTTAAILGLTEYIKQKDKCGERNSNLLVQDKNTDNSQKRINSNSTSNKFWNGKRIDVVYRADKQKGDTAGKIWCDPNKSKEECAPQVVVYHVKNLSDRVAPPDTHPVWGYVAGLDIPLDNSIENYGYQLFDANGNLK